MKFLLLFFLFSPSFISANSNLLITEVQVRGETPNNCFIKIYNPNNVVLDISGYRLRKKTSTGREYSIRVFPEGSIINAKGYFIWANSRDDYHLFLQADAYSTASISANNSIAFFSNDGLIIDALAWGEGENQFVLGNPFPFNPQEKEKIKRIKNDFYQNTDNNEKDFYLFSENQDLELDYNIQTSLLEKDEQFPLVNAISFSLILAAVFIYFKKVVKEV